MKKEVVFYETPCIYCYQVDEEKLRSLVTKPWNTNYIYAKDYSFLPRIKNLALSKACYRG